MVSLTTFLPITRFPITTNSNRSVSRGGNKSMSLAKQPPQKKMQIDGVINSCSAHYSLHFSLFLVKIL
jgi:hypothetical protein